MRQKEIAQLKRRIQARSLAGKKGQKLRQKLGLTSESAPSLEQDKQELQKLQQELQAFQRNQVERKAMQNVKRKIREEIESGQRSAPFIKRQEWKRLRLEAKYDELQKQGAVDKALVKRRKKNKTKHSNLMG
jgi:3-methyladenine DNA glycosylase Tag